MITTRPAPSSSRTAAATTQTPPPANRGMRRSALVAGTALLVLAVLSAAANFGLPGDQMKVPIDVGDTIRLPSGATGWRWKPA